MIPTLAQAVRVGTPEVLLAKEQGRASRRYHPLLANDLSRGNSTENSSGDAADDAVATAEREAALHFTKVNGAVDARRHPEDDAQSGLDTLPGSFWSTLLSQK